MKSDHKPGTGQTNAVVAIVGASLVLLAVVTGAAVLVSAAGTSPLVIATTATLIAGSSGYLLATAETGRPVLVGGPLGAGILADTGARIADSLKAGNVFVTSTDPAKLMRLGTGVGSAIVGPKGMSFGQAAFRRE